MFSYDTATVNGPYHNYIPWASHLIDSNQHLMVVVNGIDSAQTDIKSHLYEFDALGQVLNVQSWHPSTSDTVYIIEWIGSVKSKVWVCGDAKIDTQKFIFHAQVDTACHLVNPILTPYPGSTPKSFVDIVDIDTSQGHIRIFAARLIGWENYPLSFVQDLDTSTFQVLSTRLIKSQVLDPSTLDYGFGRRSRYDPILQKFKMFYFPRFDSSNVPVQGEVFGTHAVVNMDTNWNYEHSKSRFLWKPRNGTDTGYAASLYCNLVINQTIGYTDLDSNTYLLAGGMLGNLKTDPILSAPTKYFTALFVMDRYTDSMLKEIVLPCYDTAWVEYSSHRLSSHHAVLRGKDKRIYVVGNELCVQNNRDNLFIHCLDSNLNYLWYKALPSFITLQANTDAVLDSADHIIVIGNSWNYPFNYQYKAYIFKVDSTGALFTNAPTMLESDAGYTLYPNPSSQYIMLKGGNLQGAQAQIFDLSGRRVMDAKLSAQQDVSVLPLRSGNYFIVVSKNSKRLFQAKFQKQ